jgi:phosphoribosyl 1,2-cyclic phosphate phosphodiesterase
MRCSLYIEGSGGERALIDAGPEFRIQALRAGITRLDAVFLTHAHADHMHGIDDLRPLSYRAGEDGVEIPVYGTAETIAEFRERFSYIFTKTQEGGGKPRIETRAVPAGQEIPLGNLVFTPVPVKHGDLDIFGWKIRPARHLACAEHERGTAGRSAVYLTDTSGIDEGAYRLIAEGGKPAVLIIGALRKRPHETHFNFDQALEAALRAGADKTFLTHLCHEHAHREIEDYCRSFAQANGFAGLMSPAWDGLELEIEEQRQGGSNA